MMIAWSSTLLLRSSEGAVTYAFRYQIMGAGETHKIMDVPLFKDQNANLSM
jgi:hypothetical protein